MMSKASLVYSLATWIRQPFASGSYDVEWDMIKSGMRRPGHSGGVDGGACRPDAERAKRVSALQIEESLAGLVKVDIGTSLCFARCSRCVRLQLG